MRNGFVREDLMKEETPLVLVDGIPEHVAETASAIFRSRITSAARSLHEVTGLDSFSVSITYGGGDRGGSTASRMDAPGEDDEYDVARRARRFLPAPPLYRFDNLVTAPQMREELISAAEWPRVKQTVYQTWGLQRIEPRPSLALNFYGRPGTGKTMAAHAVAERMKSSILEVNYAQIESKYHGEGPKNIEAAFYAAERHNAVMFIDEADSLLSKRLTEVTQGLEQSINAMRSQLLVSLGAFRGLVIFATNLLTAYDKGFETRLRTIRFDMPDRQCRARIWNWHLTEELPLAADVTVEALSEIEDLCGRDIKNAVIGAAIDAARLDIRKIPLAMLIEGAERVKRSRFESINAAEHEEPTLGTDNMAEAVRRAAVPGQLLPKAEFCSHG
jgi:SpoVK/Ycf46/Vps4 family AAA+-type ATPase